jgi:phage-related protein
VSSKHKPLVWLHGEVKSPPFSREGRIEAEFLLRRLQRGDLLEMPASRPMPSIGAKCHELRINDTTGNWRVVLRIDSDAIVIAMVFAKKTRVTPKVVIDTCKKRFKEYDGARK